MNKLQHLFTVKIFVIFSAIVFAVILVTNIFASVFSVENWIKTEKITKDYQKNITATGTVDKTSFFKKQETIKKKINIKKQNLVDNRNQYAQLSASLDLLKDQVTSTDTSTPLDSTVKEMLSTQIANTETALMSLNKEADQISNDLLDLEKDHYEDYVTIFDKNIDPQFLMTLTTIIEKRKNVSFDGESINEDTMKEVLEKCYNKSSFLTTKQEVEYLENQVYDPNTKTLIKVKKPFGKSKKIMNVNYSLKDYETIYKDFNLSTEEINQMNQSLKSQAGFNKDKLSTIDFESKRKLYIEGKMTETEQEIFLDEIKKLKNVETLDKPNSDVYRYTEQEEDVFESAIQNFMKLNLSYYPNNKLTQKVIEYEEADEISSTLPKGVALIDNLINKYIGIVNFIDQKFTKVLNVIEMIKNFKIEDLKEFLSSFDFASLVNKVGENNPLDSILNLSQNSVDKIKKYKEKIDKFGDKVSYISNLIERVDTLTENGKNLYKEISTFPKNIVSNFDYMTNELKELPEESKKAFEKTIKEIQNLDDDTKKLVNLKITNIQGLGDLTAIEKKNAESLIKSISTVSSVQNVDKIITKTTNFSSDTKYYLSKINESFEELPQEQRNSLQVNTLSLKESTFVKLNNDILPSLSNCSQEEIAFLDQAINNSSYDFSKTFEKDGKTGVIKETRNLLQNANLDVSNVSGVSEAIISVISVNEDKDKINEIIRDLSFVPIDKYNQIVDNITAIPYQSVSELRDTFNDVADVPLEAMRDISNIVTKAYSLKSDVVENCITLGTQFSNIPTDTLNRINSVVYSILDTPFDITNQYLNTISGVLLMPSKQIETYSNALNTVLTFPQAQLDEFNSLVSQTAELGTEVTDLVFEITSDEELKELMSSSIASGYSDFSNFISKYNIQDNEFFKQYNSVIKNLNAKQIEELNKIMKSGNLNNIKNALYNYCGADFVNNLIAKYGSINPFAQQVAPFTGLASSLLGFNHYSQYYTKYEKDSDTEATTEANKMKDLSFNSEGYYSYNKGTDNLNMVVYIYKLIGLSIGNSILDIYNNSVQIDRTELKKGDLAFKSNPTFTPDDSIAIFYETRDNVDYFLTFEKPFQDVTTYNSTELKNYTDFSSKKATIKPLPDYNTFRTVFKKNK